MIGQHDLLVHHVPSHPVFPSWSQIASSLNKMGGGGRNAAVGVSILLQERLMWRLV